MNQPRRETHDLPTTNINLAACLLSLVPGSALEGVDPTPSVDGRRLIHISYPAAQHTAVRRLLAQFQARTLVVPLYPFNRQLNVIRDMLHQSEGRTAGTVVLSS
jgi:hypothetical protein